MTAFRDLRSVIAVHHLPSTAAFYRDVLGFTVREIDDPGWLFFERDGCVIMAGECPDEVPPADLGCHNYFAYVVMTGIEEYHRTVLERGARIIKPLRREPWGATEFGVATADGHRIMFGEFET